MIFHDLNGNPDHGATTVGKTNFVYGNITKFSFLLQDDLYVKVRRRMDKLRKTDGVKVNPGGAPGRPKNYRLHPVLLSPGVTSDKKSEGNV